MAGKPIKTACSECSKEVTLPTDLVEVYVYENGSAKYEFVCPLCSKRSTKSASEEILNLLQQAGAELKYPDKKQPYPEDIADWSVPPLTLDDAITLHFALDDVIDLILSEDHGYAL